MERQPRGRSARPGVFGHAGEAYSRAWGLSMNSSLTNWRDALLELASSDEKALEFQNHRYRFVARIARLLTDPLLKGQPSSVVYGVWLVGHAKPVYIGQTRDARRRLWDLPIGESHHLANTFPPEVWSRVVWVDWARLLSARADYRAILDNATTQLADIPVSAEAALGLAIEYRLQRDFTPLFNSRTKDRDGNWRARDLGASRSLGARMSTHAEPAIEAVKSAWEEFATIASDGRESVVCGDWGLVVFPAQIFENGA